MGPRITTELTGIALLREVLKHIDEHPEELDQDWWARIAPTCGTTCCAAGHTVRLAGWHFVWDPYPRDEFIATFCERDGQTRQIAELASELLGLSPEEAYRLFYGCADREEIQHVAELIAVDRGETL